MKYIISYSILILLGTLIFFSCAEPRHDLTGPQETLVHGEGALVENSEGFHAFLVKDQGIHKCQTCHAYDYSGGVTDISCSSEACHENVDIHQEGINNPSGENFHGLYLAKYDGFYECKMCHGNDWNGGIVSPSCQDCHTSINVHQDGLTNPTSENFHGNFIRNTNWNLTECKQCHGENYGGQLASPTCLTCHSEDNGPEACNTCHGDFSDPSNIAPPQGTNNETSTTSAAVGAHQVHLYGITISENVPCSECHAVPSQFASEGHIDETGNAEVIFGNYENYNDSLGAPTYNFEEMTCENSYCHGNFKFIIPPGVEVVGNNFSPNWTTIDGSQAKCGTCHGEIGANGELVTPMPKGHFGNYTITECAVCHGKVVDSEGNIVDKTLHINGKSDVDFSFF